jgi:hypothetical protein
LEERDAKHRYVARHPKSAIADFGNHLRQAGNIRLGMREPGGG